MLLRFLAQSIVGIEVSVYDPPSWRPPFVRVEETLPVESLFGKNDISLRWHTTFLLPLRNTTFAELQSKFLARHIRCKQSLCLHTKGVADHTSCSELASKDRQQRLPLASLLEPYSFSSCVVVSWCRCSATSNA